MRFIFKVVLYLTLIHCVSYAYTLDTINKIATTDGSNGDLQNAHDDASVVSGAGWSITSPDGGSDTFTGQFSISKSIVWKSSGSGFFSVSGVLAGGLVNVANSSSGNTMIVGGKFVGPTVATTGNEAKIVVSGSVNNGLVVLTNCYFTEENATRSTRIEVNRVLITYCHFSCDRITTAQVAQGVEVKNDSDTEGTWDTASTLGTLDTGGAKNVYVENCYFTNYYLQAFDFDGAARVVVRFCHFEDSAITSHGADTGPIGMRQADIYKNRFVFNDFGDCSGLQTAPLDYFIFWRGGTGNCYSNTFDRLDSCAWGSKNEIKLQVQNIRRNAGTHPCQTSYPAFHQPGTGHNGTSAFVDLIYFWNNEITESTLTIGGVQYEPDECMNGQLQSNYIIEGRDWTNNIARPSYTGYQYPWSGVDPTAPTRTNSALSGRVTIYGNVRIQ